MRNSSSDTNLLLVIKSDNNKNQSQLFEENKLDNNKETNIEKQPKQEPIKEETNESANEDSNISKQELIRPIPSSGKNNRDLQLQNLKSKSTSSNNISPKYSNLSLNQNLLNNNNNISSIHLNSHNLNNLSNTLNNANTPTINNNLNTSNPGTGISKGPGPSGLVVDDDISRNPNSYNYNFDNLLNKNNYKSKGISPFRLTPEYVQHSSGIGKEIDNNSNINNTITNILLKSSKKLNLSDYENTKNTNNNTNNSNTNNTDSFKTFGNNINNNYNRLNNTEEKHTFSKFNERFNNNYYNTNNSNPNPNTNNTNEVGNNFNNYTTDNNMPNPMKIQSQLFRVEHGMNPMQNNNNNNIPMNPMLMQNNYIQQPNISNPNNMGYAAFSGVNNYGQYNNRFIVNPNNPNTNENANNMTATNYQYNNNNTINPSNPNSNNFRLNSSSLMNNYYSSNQNLSYNNSSSNSIKKKHIFLSKKRLSIKNNNKYTTTKTTNNHNNTHTKSNYNNISNKPNPNIINLKNMNQNTTNNNLNHNSNYDNSSENTNPNNPINTYPNNPSNLSRSNSLGLKEISDIVLQILKQHPTTSYKFISDEIIRKANVSQADEKNIRRRIYDALNVMLALEIFNINKTNNGKVVKYNFLNHEKTKRQMEQELINQMSENITDIEESLKIKKATICAIEEKKTVLDYVINRNCNTEKFEEKNLIVKIDERIEMPFIVAEMKENSTEVSI